MTSPTFEMTDDEVDDFIELILWEAETSVRNYGFYKCDRMRAAMRKAMAAAVAKACEWRPIESAPKDGRKFLTWDKVYGIRIGRAFIRANHDDWLSYCDGFNGSSKGGARATHW
ncbi:MAG: hypothetical protein KGI54_16715, partial [Pseudomonadota bacterium]|nr:hypothetical protein [Pseudomonadota bacterium]